MKLSEVFLATEDEQEEKKPKSSTKKKDTKAKKDKEPEKVADKPAPSLASLAKQKDTSSEKTKEKTPDVKSDPDFLKAVQKGLSASDDKKMPDTKSDPDFLKATQKGLKATDSPVAQAADRIANKFYKRADPPSSSGAGDKVPSLSQLAKDVGSNDSKEDDSTFKDFPKFDKEPEELPFGNPVTKEPERDYSTTPLHNSNPYNSGQKMTKPSLMQKVGQGLKKGVSALGKGAQNISQKAKEVPSTWKKPNQPVTTNQSSEPMPSMASTAAQGIADKTWRSWKPGSTKNIGFVRDLTVVDVDQYGARLKGKNGAIYRFVPHRGLRKISN